MFDDALSLTSPSINHTSPEDEKLANSACLNCGKNEDDGVTKLKSCMGCKMFKYCSRDCQIANRPKHKKLCKIRAAELHDEALFRQPQKEECPICFLRMPSTSGWKYTSCCGKVICGGCSHAPVYDDQGTIIEETCPFCRTPAPTSNEEIQKRFKERLDLNDPVALHTYGIYHARGKEGFPQNDAKAVELWHRAGKLGYAKANATLGYAYDFGGQGVEVDKKKAKHHYELAAIGGEAYARYNLGYYEARAGNMDRAVKHFILAAGGGYKDSLEIIKRKHAGYDKYESLKLTKSLSLEGHVTKDDCEKALKAYQTYQDEIRSDHRDQAAAFSSSYEYF